MKKFKNVKVSYESEYFEIEVGDEELEFAKKCGIDINNDGEIVKFHLESHFEEHQDLLDMDDYEYELEESKENDEI